MNTELITTKLSATLASVNRVVFEESKSFKILTIAVVCELIDPSLLKCVKISR